MCGSGCGRGHAYLILGVQLTSHTLVISWVDLQSEQLHVVASKYYSLTWKYDVAVEGQRE